MINESGTEAMCVGFMRMDKLLRMLDVFFFFFFFFFFFHYFLIYDFFHYSLIYYCFGKMNDLKCLLKLPAEFMKKGFSILTIFHMLLT